MVMTHWDRHNPNDDLLNFHRSTLYHLRHVFRGKKTFGQCLDYFSPVRRDSSANPLLPALLIRSSPDSLIGKTAALTSRLTRCPWSGKLHAADGLEPPPPENTDAPPTANFLLLLAVGGLRPLDPVQQTRYSFCWSLGFLWQCMYCKARLLTKIPLCWACRHLSFVKTPGKNKLPMDYDPIELFAHLTKQGKLIKGFTRWRYALAWLTVTPISTYHNTGSMFGGSGSPWVGSMTFSANILNPRPSPPPRFGNQEGASELLNGVPRSPRGVRSSACSWSLFIFLRQKNWTLLKKC